MENKLTKYLSLILVFFVLFYLFFNTTYLDFLKIEVNYDNLWTKEREKKEKKEISKLKRRANAGGEYAQFRVGELFLKNLNYNEAFKYLKMSAEHGNSDSELLLYNIYYYKQDKKRALNYLTRAAEHGNTTAMRYLGYMCLHGDKEEGVKKNSKKAFKLYSKASEFGDIYATTELAFLYYYDQGVKKKIINKPLNCFLK